MLNTHKMHRPIPYAALALCLPHGFSVAASRKDRRTAAREMQLTNATNKAFFLTPRPPPRGDLQNHTHTEALIRLWCAKIRDDW